MAIRTSKPQTSNESLALELVKAALHGGALAGAPISGAEVAQDIDALNKFVGQRARLDSAYVYRLYSGILSRLDEGQANRS